MSRMADYLIGLSETATETTLTVLKTQYTFNDYEGFKNRLLNKAIEFINDDPELVSIDMIICFDGTMVLDHDGSIIGHVIKKEVFWLEIKDLLKLQNDLSRKQSIIDNLLFLIRSTNVTMNEKAALKKAVQELEKTVKQLETALSNNI